jgi:phage-related minor tail protein
MNKDLYIQLLEEHVDDLTTAAKIDTVLSLRKTEKIRDLKSELASVQDWNKAQDELISKIADTAMDCIDDLNDAQADWAADHTEYRRTLETIKGQNTRECDLNVRLQGKIAELEKEKAQLAKKNQCLLEDIKAYGKALAVKEGNK